MLAACALLGCLAPALAAPTARPARPAPTGHPAPAASARNDEQEAAAVRELDNMLTRSFRLPETLKLDPALRAEADQIGAAHVARIRQLLPLWLREETKLQAGDGARSDAATVYWGVLARLLNEFALWQIEPGDAAYEKAMVETLKDSPFACTSEADIRFQDFEARIVRVQAMPPAQRPAALAAERELLAHWGKPRATLPQWPNPLPQEAAMEAVERIRAGGPRPPQALTPVLASSLLAKRQDYAALPWETKCLFQQWWLRTSLAQGAAPETALAAFRYGTLLTATERFGRAFESQQGGDAPGTPSGRPAYPKLATRFEVTGRTRVSRRVDASGKPQQASVVGRDIQVRGIRGVRPVAFEDAFDATILRFALDGQVSIPGNKKDTQVFDYVWTLEENTPAQAPATAAQGDKR